MVKYYEVTVEFLEELGNGKEKKRKEIILVNALSVTESEATVTKHLNEVAPNADFTVKQSRESRIVEVVG
jgi:hypothetical protein